MTTFDRSNLEAVELERRLRDWMRRDPAVLDLTELYDAVTLSTRDERPRATWRVARANRADLDVRATPSAGRRVALVAVGALIAVLAAGVGLFIGDRLLNHGPKPQVVPGIFQPTGDIPESAGWLIRPSLATLPDGRIVLVGGGQEIATAYVYDQASGTYGEPIGMFAARQGATATTLRDGRVLVTGGQDGLTGAILDTAELLDLAEGRSLGTGVMTGPRDGHSASLLPDGRVLIVGGTRIPAGSATGQSYTHPIGTSEVYDPSTGGFGAAGSLHVGRVGHTATTLPDGRILVVGGYALDGGGVPTIAAAAEIYDPSTGAFRTVGSLGLPRAHHSATLLEDGCVLIAGGEIGNSAEGLTRTITGLAELFDPLTDTFRPTGELTTERANHAAIRLADGRVLVVGGDNAFGPPATSEIYDPATGAFSLSGATDSEHGIGLAVLLADGRVFVPGGGRAPTSGSELFDPAAAPIAPAATTSTSTPDWLTPVPMTLRAYHTSNRLDDGRVLVTGGYGGPENRPLSTADLFDPATGRVSETGSMGVERMDHVATRLADGRVLVAAGDERTAQIYDPATGRFDPAGPGITAALQGRRPLETPGLPDGQMLLVSFDDPPVIAMFDAERDRLGPSAPACFHYWGAVGLRDGRVFITCGRPDDDDLLFDPDAGTIMSAGFGGAFSCLVPLDDGRVLLCSPTGGEVEAVYDRITTVYDPIAGTLTDIEPEGSLNPKAGVMVSLGDGRILDVGGADGNMGSGVSIISTATWTRLDVGSLLTPRTDADVIVLDDGRVLIVGGASQSADRTDPVPPGAEVLDLTAIP